MVTVPCESEANCLSIQKKFKKILSKSLIHWKSISIRLKCYNFIRLTQMMEGELQIVEKISSNF